MGHDNLEQSMYYEKLCRIEFGSLFEPVIGAIERHFGELPDFQTILTNCTICTDYSKSVQIMPEDKHGKMFAFVEVYWGHRTIAIIEIPQPEQIFVIYNEKPV
jgi:hypothetical protein